MKNDNRHIFLPMAGVAAILREWDIDYSFCESVVHNYITPCRKPEHDIMWYYDQLGDA